MSWSGKHSFTWILDIHIVVIITIPVSFKTPTWTILELLWDLPHIPVWGSPFQWWNTISCVDFKGIECRPCSKGNTTYDFPKLDPFTNFLILIDHFSLLEVQCWIRIHRRGLHKWLELISRVSRSSFKPENSFNRFFFQNWVSKSISYMREFLFISPFNIILASLIVIVMMSLWPLLQPFLEIDLLGLWEPGSCWLSPSVIEFKEHVVQMHVLVTGCL